MSIVEDHFKLHHPPFPQVVDKAALLSHPALKDAVERLRFALDRDAIALLTAESGCGKTTALAQLVRDLDATAHQVIYSSMARSRRSAYSPTSSPRPACARADSRARPPTSSSRIAAASPNAP